ncbi:hypothetical protein DFH06DRAFT_1324291 [Mycena polygramma]|nr:hypothetical protein DFH06DRAFT_1324291 [Mycena polygramma]
MLHKAKHNLFPASLTAFFDFRHDNTERFCDVCSKLVKYGKGGHANWDTHVGSEGHETALKAAAAAGKARQITSFFSARPPPIVAEASGASSNTPASHAVPVPPSPSSDLADVDMDLDDSSPSLYSGQITILLSRLRVVISTLPSSIPFASGTDLIASFANVDMMALVGHGQELDPWPEMHKLIQQMFDSLLCNDGQPRNAVQLSQLIRRGELGMNGFADWIEKCFFTFNLPLEMGKDHVEQVIQAMLLLGAKTSEDFPPEPHAPISEPSASARPDNVPQPIGCPGQELPLKDGKPSFLSYPLALNAERDLPWGVEFGQKLIVRSHGCKRHSQASGVCFPCGKLLRNGVIKGIIERNAHGVHPNTPFTYLTADETLSRLRDKNEQINALKLAGLTLSQTLLVRATHLAAHSRLQLAVGRGDVPRIHSIVANCRKNGDSIFTCIDKIGRAATGSFSNQSCTHDEHQLLYLLLKLGGHAVAEIGHRCFGLPSITTAKRHIATTPLISSPRAPTMQEMCHNLDTAFPVPHPAPSDGSRGPGFQIMIDEIKVEGRMRWDPRSNMILGICREHSANFELEFKGMEQAEALHAGLANNSVHLASEATVAAISSFSDVPSRNIAHPFIVAPTCKRESADEQRILLEAAVAAAKAKAGRIGGRLYCFSSDGDNKRRLAMILFTFMREVDRNGPLFQKLGDLPLFDYHCGDDDITANIDEKHVMKRLRNTLIRQLASTVNGARLIRRVTW